MVQWQVINGQLQLMFQSREDIIEFINTVVKGPAEQLGLEIIVKEKELGKKKALDTVRI